MTPVKKSGIKLHIGVDVLGLPHAMMVTTADKTDRDGAVGMVSRYYYRTNNFFRLKKILVDGGYSGENFASAIRGICKVEAEVVKRNDLHKFVVLAKRWIAERTFGWLDKCAGFGKTASANCTAPYKW